MELIPCPECARHVRRTRTCPFCDAPLPRAWWPHRLARAAVLAGVVTVAACDDDEPVQQPQLPVQQQVAPQPQGPSATLQELPRMVDPAMAEGAAQAEEIATADDPEAEERKRRERERARQRRLQRQQQLLRQKQLRDIHIAPPYGAPPPPDRTV